jgi:hypothetical protein
LPSAFGAALALAAAEVTAFTATSAALALTRAETACGAPGHVPCRVFHLEDVCVSHLGLIVAVERQRIVDSAEP